jgi:anaphase-promoting complex subunit 2
MVGLAHATMASPDFIFSSIFPAATLDHTTPTPVATPDLAFAAPGQSFGSITSPVSHKQQHPLSAAQLQVKRTIAWSTATRFLSLAALSAADPHSIASFAGPHRIKTREVEDAIDFLLSGAGPHGLFEEDLDLVDWYMLEVRTHFLDHVAPSIQQAWSAVRLIPAPRSFD